MKMPGASLLLLITSVYDGFFLSMLATKSLWRLTESATILVNSPCTYRLWLTTPLCLYSGSLLMFADNALAVGMGLDFGWQQLYAPFCGRIALLSILALLLWTWTIIVARRRSKWGFLIWVLFSYYGRFCIARCSEVANKKLRRALLLRDQQGISFSEFGREAVETLIQELPKFRLKAVPTDCSECPICLEEFCAGNEVRGLPCAHNFHTECIDKWLGLNIKCPRCRCSVFSNLDMSFLSNTRADERSSSSIIAPNSYIRTQPASQRGIW